jgi:hypothetical protein
LPEIESAIVRVVAEVSRRLEPALTERPPTPSPRFPVQEAEKLLAELGTGAAALLQYLDSPDFATVATQLRLDLSLGEVAKDQLREGLRLAGVENRLLDRTVHLVHEVLRAACADLGGRRTKVDLGDLLVAGAENSQMLMRLKSLTEFHSFAARLRGQVAALHNSIRLPHIGVSRAVPYDQLYVLPNLDPPTFHLGAPNDRTVILGDPGAGKSTLAAKFAHGVATDDTGRVPFLVVLREFGTAFAEGGRSLLDYLEMVCRAPYNVQPPHDGVEYLLRTGRAVVILDGLDELVRTELRRRTVKLVESFAHLYPLVPVVVTARKVGYQEAPLAEELFTHEHIREFEKTQVRDYVRLWFALDDATSPSERARLADSFMADSEQIPELRSNPLLLALLCAMYSSDRYLPRNLAQVYERCALMMFEQWDSKRGITLPLKFHGRLRGAVQHLAWRLFTADESEKALSRPRIINLLVGYLEDKLDDYDESLATAEEFLAFCTGRAWILTDVGAEKYGFTHRTFLEYFAAEHVVRTRRTAEDLWATLKPKIGQWDVVAQIALQLYDRNVDGGVDEFLTKALADGGTSFAARSLRHVHPAARTVRAIVTAAMDLVVLRPIEKYPDDAAVAAEIYAPLFNCLFESSAAHKASIDQIFLHRVDESVKRGEPGIALMVEILRLKTGWPPRQIYEVVVQRYRRQLGDLSKGLPWAGSTLALTMAGVVPEIVRRHGMQALYREHSPSAHSSFAAAVFADYVSGLPEIDAVVEAIITAPTPWLDEEPSRSWLNGLKQTTLQVLLSLPALEGRYPDGNQRHIPPFWRIHDQPPAVRQFLDRWERGEISVLAPDPEQQPPPPAQR